MSLSNIMDIASTGMSAESVRLNLSASNLANANTIGSSPETVYHAKQPVFQALLDDSFALEANGEQIPNAGVQVVDITKSSQAIRKEYKPEHPQADQDGYIYLPNVDSIQEMTNVISASRDYQKNVELMKTAHDLMVQTLRIAD